MEYFNNILDNNDNKNKICYQQLGQFYPIPNPIIKSLE